MSYILTADRPYRLTAAGELRLETPIKFHSRASTLDFLRRFLRVPSSMEALASALASESSVSKNRADKISDHKVLEEIATLLLQNRLYIAPIEIPRFAFAQPVEPDISKKGRELLLDFENKVSEILQPSAKDLAAGKTSKDVDGETILPMLSDLMVNLPLSDSELGKNLGRFLGLSGRQMGLSPKDLGDEAGENALGYIDSLRKDKPLLFWPGAVAAGLGAGALTYSQGTEVLGRVGLDPKFSKEFLNDKISVAAEGAFGPKLSDPTATISSKQWLTENLSLWQSATASGPELSKMGLSKYNLGMDYKVPLSNPEHSLNVGASYLRDMESDKSIISSYLRGETPNSTYGLESKYDLMSSDHDVTGYYGRKLGWGSSFEGYGSHQNWGGVESSSVGLRLIKRF